MTKAPLNAEEQAQLTRYIDEYQSSNKKRLIQFLLISLAAVVGTGIILLFKSAISFSQLLLPLVGFIVLWILIFLMLTFISNKTLNALKRDLTDNYKNEGVSTIKKFISSNGHTTLSNGMIVWKKDASQSWKAGDDIFFSLTPSGNFAFELKKVKKKK